MKKQLLRNIGVIVLLLAVCLVAAAGPVQAAGGDKKELPNRSFIDVTGDFWAKTAINNWNSRGVVQGDGNRFYPQEAVTRAQLAAILIKVVGYSETADNPFIDVKDGDWYYEVLKRAYAQGILLGSLDSNGQRRARPNDPLTRAEAAVLFKNVFVVTREAGFQSSFKDTNIPEWAREAVFDLEAEGYIKGRGPNLFDPEGRLSRAEAVQMLDNIVKLFINTAGNYSGDVDGNCVINTPGVMLSNMKINGNLYLAPGIGEGEVTLENVIVTGRTFIRGGGPGKITVTGCDLGELIIEKAGFEPKDFVADDEPSPPQPPVSGGGGGSGNSGDPVLPGNPPEPPGASIVDC